MEKETWLKFFYELAVIFNALSIIIWTFLAIFPGIHFLSEGNIIMGVQTIFLNVWCYAFGSTLIIGILLHYFLEKAKGALISE